MNGAAFLAVLAALIVSARTRLTAVIFGQPVSIPVLWLVAAAIVLLLAVLLAVVVRNIVRDGFGFKSRVGGADVRLPKLPCPRWPKRGKKTATSLPRPIAQRRGDFLVRLATVLAVVAVAGVAAYVSYWHAVEVVTHHGERGLIGHLYPIVIDGIIVAASMVVLDAARHIETAPVLAWLLLLAGIAVTLAANVTYGVTFGLAGALWAAWPAVAFVGCYELLMMLVRASARRAERAASGTVSSPLPGSAEALAEASLRVTIAAGNPWKVNQLQEHFRLTRTEATKLRQRVLAESNGHAPEPDGEQPPDTTP